MAERKPNAAENWPDKFLASYAKCGNITKAAKAAKVDRKTVYNRQEADAEFEAAMNAAQEEAVDLLEEEARRRAADGTLKPIFYKGEKVATVREYSDTLLIVLLKANRPEKYKERADITSGGKVIKAYIGFDTEQV